MPKERHHPQGPNRGVGVRRGSLPDVRRASVDGPTSPRRGNVPDPDQAAGDRWEELIAGEDFSVPAEARCLPERGVELCQELARRLGLDRFLSRDPMLMALALEKAAERYYRTTQRPYGHVDVGHAVRSAVADLLLGRAFLWALTNDVLLTEVKRAFRAAGIERQEEVFARIEEQLLPNEEDKDPGAFFDPWAWRFDLVGARASDLEDAFLRLGLFRVAMRMHGRSLAKQGLTPQSTAEAIVRQRARRGIRV